MQPYLFVSYSTKDAGMIMSVVQILERRGIPCWFAPHNLVPGTADWSMAIKAAIGKCSAAVLFATPNSEQSVWVARETMVALELGKRIFAFWCSGNSAVEVLPLHLSTHQLIDVRDLIAQGQYEKLVSEYENFLKGALIPTEEVVLETPKAEPRKQKKNSAIELRREEDRSRKQIGNDHVFVYVPEGKFLMGNGRQEIYLPSYYIGKYTVSYRQFEEFINETGYITLAEKEGFGWLYQGNILVPQQELSWRTVYDRLPSKPQNIGGYPVTLLTRSDMYAFCNWLQGKLSLEENMSLSIPDEAQWEKAARGGLEVPRRVLNFFASSPISRKPSVDHLFRITPLKANPSPDRGYPWGNAELSLALACYSQSFFVEVSKYDVPEAQSPYGCVQMVGNVWEACSNLFAANIVVRDNKFIAPTEGIRYVSRGGYFASSPAQLTVTSRLSEEDKPILGIGFRLIININ